MPITLVPAKEHWAGTVPAVMPTQGRYWPSTTMFTGLYENDVFVQLAQMFAET